MYDHNNHKLYAVTSKFTLMSSIELLHQDEESEHDAETQ